MYRDFKYAWDCLFVLVLLISLSLFLLDVVIGMDHTILTAVENIDIVLLGGYYAFFAHDLYRAKHKIDYCKKHWVLIVLLILPALPIARLARFARLERVFAIAGNTAWHILDQLEML